MKLRPDFRKKRRKERTILLAMGGQSVSRSIVLFHLDVLNLRY